MTLGTSRPRNWGKDSQMVALALVLKCKRVAFDLRTTRALDGRRRQALWLTPSHNGVTLPFVQSFADIVHVKRGVWTATHPWDGRVLARGVSERDVVRATIEAIWH